MKKVIFLFAIFLAGYATYAQTNTFPTTGNVGIGTLGPLAPLHVFGNLITAGHAANIDGSNIDFLSNSAQLLIGWNRSGGYGEIDFIGNQGAGGQGGFAFYNHNNSNVETQLMYISGTGDVGIGTSTPDAKLAVAGTIHAKEVKVNLIGWPDYVFKPTYKLPTLAEVKTYIEKNQRLPEMPSEQEVANNGINLGGMVKLQTKKIEELTLYLIDKDKQVNHLQSELNLLKEQLNLLIKSANKKLP
jgi:hypothetical protein